MLGEELVNALADGERAVRLKRTEVADRCVRTFTLLCRAYDTAQRAIAFLRWHEKDASLIAPSLFAREPGRRKRTSRQTSPQEAAAPQTASNPTADNGATETQAATG